MTKEMTFKNSVEVINAAIEEFEYREGIKFDVNDDEHQSIKESLIDHFWDCMVEKEYFMSLNDTEMAA